MVRILRPEAEIVTQSGRGKGNALRCGFERCTSDIIVVMDADGSADPSELPAFVNTLLRGAGYAKGSRFLPGGGSADITRVRSLGNAGLTALVNRLFRAEFTDLCYGYNAFWRDALDVILPDSPGFEVETAMSLRAHRSRLRVVEVPSYEFERRHGVSNLRTFRDGARVLSTILRERTCASHGYPLPDRRSQVCQSTEKGLSPPVPRLPRTTPLDRELVSSVD